MLAIFFSSFYLMYFVFIYYVYLYNVLHFILNKSIHPSKVNIFSYTIRSFGKCISSALECDMRRMGTLSSSA